MGALCATLDLVSSRVASLHANFFMVDVVYTGIWPWKET